MSDAAPLVAGVDLGGTKLDAALVDAEGRIGDLRRWPRRLRDYDETLEAIVHEVGVLRERARRRDRTLDAVGVAVAAFLDPDRSRVLQAANIGWRDRPLRDDLAERLALPVTLVNDADAAAWGEHRHGAGAGARCLLLVTLGTGVGSGIVLGGRLVTGGSGLGAELGHLVVERGGLPCVCGAQGCLEQYASATALARIARELCRGEPHLASALVLLAGDVEGIGSPHVVQAARRRDPLATRAVESVGEQLGRALAQVTALLDPTLILLGGGLTAAGELLLASVRAAYAEALTIRVIRQPAPVRFAAYGATAGIVGAAAHARAAACPVAAAPA